MRIAKDIYKILLIAAASFMIVLFSNSVKADDIPVAADNIYIENTCVAGMNEEQINEVIQNKMNAYLQSTITINVGSKSVDVSASEFGLYQTNTDLTSKILNIGKKGSIWKRYKIANHLDEKQGEIFDLKFAISQDDVRSVVENKCVQLNVDRVDMGLVMSDDGSFVTTDKTDGISVDVESTVAAICDYMNNDWHGGSSEINAVTTTDAALGDTDSLALVKDVLGEGSTTYETDGDKATRAANIAVGTSKINGAVIYPGEEFSAESYLVPFTAEAGYLEAGTYLNGETVDDFGGGICQVTSTLYRAVLESELEVTERCEHSMVVGYVEPSMDAAVAEGIKDLKFVNNTDAPIYIEGTAVDGTVTFKIYGHETRDPARTISFESKVLTQTTEVNTVIELDSSIDFGEIESSQGHIGMTAVAYKIVYMNGEQISKEQINSSEYKESDQTYKIGTKGATASQLSDLQTAVDNKNMAAVYSITGASDASS